MIVVGDQLWWVPSDERRKDMACAVTVTAVGRKWLTLSNAHRVDKTTLRGDGRGYSIPGRCYASEAEYHDIQKRDATWSAFRHAVERSWSCPVGVSLQQIQDAAAALNIVLVVLEYE